MALAGQHHYRSLKWKGHQSLKTVSSLCEVDSVVLTQAIEILDVTPKAQKSIAAVKIWAE